MSDPEGREILAMGLVHVFKVGFGVGAIMLTLAPALPFSPALAGETVEDLLPRVTGPSALDLTPPGSCEAEPEEKTPLQLAVRQLEIPKGEDDGTNTGGGGDGTELRVDEIRTDILRWIGDDGHVGLRFQKGTKASEYAKKMQEILAQHRVVVSFVTTAQEDSPNNRDAELKVNVAGQAKTCRGFLSKKDKRPHILCNTERFRRLSASEQYRLIHHEYAGLAGLEKNSGASSDYHYSRQITDFLKPETVWRLSVKRRAHKISWKGVYRLVSKSGNAMDECPQTLQLEEASNYDFEKKREYRGLKESWPNHEDIAIADSQRPVGYVTSPLDSVTLRSVEWDTPNTLVSVTRKFYGDVPGWISYNPLFWALAFTPITFALTHNGPAIPVIGETRVVWWKHLDDDTLQQAERVVSAEVEKKRTTRLANCRYSRVK